MQKARFLWKGTPQLTFKSNQENLGTCPVKILTWPLKLVRSRKRQSIHKLIYLARHLEYFWILRLNRRLSLSWNLLQTLLTSLLLKRLLSSKCLNMSRPTTGNLIRIWSILKFQIVDKKWCCLKAVFLRTGERRFEITWFLRHRYAL